MGGADGEKQGGDEGAKEEKKITAGYRPLWGPMGMVTFFYTLVLFPLGVIGLLLFSPIFILLLAVCVGMFAGGCVMTELEHRDPQVPEHPWQVQEREEREAKKKKEKEEKEAKEKKDKEEMERKKKEKKEEEERKKKEKEEKND